VLEFTRALAKIRNRNSLGNPHDGGADLFHYAADRAPRLIRAGALFVKFLADATHGRQRSLDVPDHRSQRDLLGRTRQPITAGNATPALNQACRLEVIEDLLQKALGDILLLGNGTDARNGFTVI